MNEGIVDLSAIIRGKGIKLVGGNMYLVSATLLGDVVVRVILYRHSILSVCFYLKLID